MAAPTNPVLTSVPAVDGMVDGNHELWSITSHMLVPKGANMEQILADMLQGKFQDGTLVFTDHVKGQKIVDITKL